MKDTLKRLLSVLLVCAMVVSMATTVFATEPDQVELTDAAPVVSEETAMVSEEATEATEEATAATEEDAAAAEEVPR